MTKPTLREAAQAVVEADDAQRLDQRLIEQLRSALSETQAGASGEPVAMVMEPLGEQFQRVLDEHRFELYAEADTAPPPQAVREPLAEARILEVVGLAPDRKVCASTCMTVKFDKKPCQCYPTSASRSEVVAIARAVESAHGITKGGRHGPA